MSDNIKLELERMFLNEDYFARNCLSDVMRVASPPFHKEMYHLLSDPSRKRVAIIAPRGHAKSTVSTTVVPLHRSLFGLEKNILIVSETDDQAEAHLENIKNNIEHNEKIRHYFGELQIVTWTKNLIVVRGGHFGVDFQIQTRGIGQKFRGLNYHQQRPTLIVMDDVESEDNMDSDEIRLKIKKKIDAAILPSIDPQIGRVFMVGTIVHYDSYLNEIYTKRDNQMDIHVGKSGRWEFVYYQAVIDIGTPQERALWPEWHPLSELYAEREELRRKEREYLWWQEYMNQPVAGEAQTFKREYFSIRHNYYLLHRESVNWLMDRRTGLPVSNVEVSVGVDPAISESRRSDHFALTILATDPADRRYVVEIILARIKSSTLQANLILNKAWNCHARVIGIETTAYQEALKGQVEEKMRKAGNYIQIVGFKPREKKNDRLKALEYPISTGLLLLPAKASETSAVEMTVGQFVEWPRGKHDDALDSIYYADQTRLVPAKRSWTREVVHKTSRQQTYNWKVL